MKKVMVLVGFLILASCGNKASLEGKTVIVYFSRADNVKEDSDALTGATPFTNNTKTLALSMQEALGCDIKEIVPDKMYPTSYDVCSAIARREVETKEVVPLKEAIDVSPYNVIILGYPLWWHKEPSCVDTFLSSNDFRGKVLIAFCTSLGGGIEKSLVQIKELCPKVNIEEARQFDAGTETSVVEAVTWIKSIMD